MPRVSAKMIGPGTTKTPVMVNYKVTRVAVRIDRSVTQYMARDASNNLKNLLKEIRKGRHWTAKFRAKQGTDRRDAVTRSIETAQTSPPQLNNVHEQGGHWKYQIDTATAGRHTTDRLWLKDVTSAVMSHAYDEQTKQFTVNVKINCNAEVEVDIY